MSQSQYNTLIPRIEDECYDYSRLDDLSLETLLEVGEPVDPLEYVLGLKPSDSVVEGQNDGQPESEITSEQGGGSTPTQDTPELPSCIPLFPSLSPEPTTDGNELEGATPSRPPTPPTFSPSFEFDDNDVQEEHDDKNDNDIPTSSANTNKDLASTDKGIGGESADVTEVLQRSPKRMRRAKSGSLSIYAEDVLPAEPPVTLNTDDLKENELIVRETQTQDASNDHNLRKRKPSNTNVEAAESYDCSAVFSRWIATPIVSTEEEHSASVDQTQRNAPLQRAIKPLPTRAQAASHYHQSHGRGDIAMMSDLGDASVPGDHQLYAAHQHRQGHFIRVGDRPHFPSTASYNGEQSTQAPAPGHYNRMPVPSNIVQYAGGSFPNTGPIQAALLPPVQSGNMLPHPSFEQVDDNAQLIPPTANTVAVIPTRPRKREYSNQYAFFIHTAPVQCGWRWRNEHGEWQTCTVMVTDVDDLWNHLWATHTVQKDGTRIRCQMGVCANKLTWLANNKTFDRHINNGEHSRFDKQMCRHCGKECARPDMYNKRHLPCKAAINTTAAQAAGSN